MASCVGVLGEGTSAGKTASRLKKVLVVTGDTGAGHNSVARTLGEALGDSGDREVRVEIVDLLAKARGLPISRASRLYGPIIVRFPRLWGLVFSLSNHTRFWRTTRMVAGRDWGNLVARTLRDHAPDSILCVHPLCNQVLAEGLRQSKPSIPLVTVITDLGKAHSAWVAPEVTLYIAPTEEVRTSLLGQGVNPGSVRLAGLSTGRRFFDETTDRREARRELGLDEGTFTVLVTGGGEGAGAILGIVRAISEAGLPVQLVVACGRNEGLRRRLERSPLAVPHLVLGFHENMPSTVKAADVVVGKAGALTIGEAVAARRPMIVVRPLPGQERGNTEYAIRQGVCIEEASLSTLVETLKGWIANPDGMKALAERGELCRGEWSHAASRIAAAVLDTVRNAEE